MVGTYDSLGKRPSARPQLGRPGVMEEALGGYTGLREAQSTYVGGLAVTGLGLFAIQAIGTPGTVRALTQATRSAAQIAANPTQPTRRTWVGLPMALSARISAAASPAGTHSVTIRVFGRNQFGEPVTEDVTLSVAASGTSPYTAMSRIFAEVDAAQIISETNTDATDLVEIDALLAQNPVIGLPIRCRAESDVVAVTILAAGVGAFVGVNAASSFVVNIKEQSVRVVIAGGFNDAAAGYMFAIHCRSTLGMDQGARTGDKFQKQW